MGYFATDTQETAPPPRTDPERARRQPVSGQKPLRGPIHNAISGYRFYNPELGRWISRDPIGEEGGLNLYVFVGIQPSAGIDGLGLENLSKFIEFLYRDLSGELKTISSSTTAEDILINFKNEVRRRDGEAGDNISILRYKSGSYDNNAKYRHMGQPDWCIVAIQLHVQMEEKFQDKGYLYTAPNVSTVFYYRKHWDGTGRVRPARIYFIPQSLDLEAYTVRTHERGHANGLLDLLNKHRLRSRIMEELNW